MLQALEHVVLHASGVGLQRDRPLVVRVEQHQVRVSAHLDGPLAGIDAVQLGRRGAAHIHKLLPCHAAGGNAIGPQGIHAVAGAGATVRDHPEVAALMLLVPAPVLLCLGDAGIVRAADGQPILIQRLP